MRSSKHLVACAVVCALVLLPWVASAGGPAEGNVMPVDSDEGAGDPLGGNYWRPTTDNSPCDQESEATECAEWFSSSLGGGFYCCIAPEEMFSSKIDSCPDWATRAPEL